MPTQFDLADVLRLPLMANLATLAEDGSPRNAPVWYHWDTTAVWMLSDATARSAERIAMDPRVAVEIVQYDNAGGILKHVGLRGRATVEPMDEDLFRALLGRYLGPEPDWNPWFIREVARIGDPSGRLIRLAPETIFTNDVSYFRTGPALVHPSGPKS